MNARTPPRIGWAPLLGAAVAWLACAAAHAQVGTLAPLGTAPGDGSVQFQVDAYGSFGYHAFGFGSGGQGDALYDPVGAVGASSTTWESAVYFRQSPASTFLSTGLVGQAPRIGALPDPGFTFQDGTTARSAFTHAGLDWELTQSVQDLIVGGRRLGTLLVQEYVIRNPGAAGATFDLVRYYEGDLYLGLGAGVPDGGGRLLVGVEEFVFETDRAGEPAETTNLVGITACGGAVPPVGRYEVNAWSAFPARIAADLPLADVVFNDGADADEFVDLGFDYDVGIALANEFTLLPGETVAYVTTTTFGQLPPADVVGGCSVVRSPIADAGPDQSGCPGADVTLAGSGSFDRDSEDGGFAESWTWDLDVTVDSDGNTVPDDDVDATGPAVTVSCPDGATTVQLTYTDDDGETATDVAIVTGKDLAPPVLDCPAVVDVVATTFQGAPAAPSATATDDCDPDPAIANDRTSGGADASDDYPCGQTLVTFTATDAGGNVDTCQTLVRVTPDATTWPVGAALRVTKLADQRPVLDWSLVGSLPPEARYSVLREEARRPPSTPAPGADRLVAPAWTESSLAGRLVLYDVRTVLCDGSLSAD